MPTIKISAPLASVTFKRVQNNDNHKFNDKRYSDFKDALATYALIAMKGRAPLAGAIKISIDVYQKFKPVSLNAGDIDNHAKAILDSLSNIAYVDDRQVTELHISLFKGEPHINITLEELL